MGRSSARPRPSPSPTPTATTDPFGIGPDAYPKGISPASTARVVGWLGRCFLPYQLRWILDNSPVALMLKARQIGITDASSARAVLWGYYHGRPQIYLSASEKVALEAISQARLHCEALAALGEVGATQFVTASKHRLEWANGGFVQAISSNPRTARGYHGDVTLDEFAFHGDPQGTLDAAGAIATRGDFRMRVLSTPNGAVGQFYEWAHELEVALAEGRRSRMAAPVVPGRPVSPDWAFHRVTLDDAIAEGLVVDTDKLWMLVGGDARIFAQNYQCAWLSSDLQYYPTEWVERACRWSGELPDLRGAEFFAGLDVGREKDLTVLTVIALVKGIAYVIAILTCRREAYRAQKELVRRAREVFPWRKLFIDATGLGNEMAEELVYGDGAGFEGFGAEEAEPLHFTNQLKGELATRGLRWLRDNAVRAPAALLEGGERLLGDEMKAMRRIVSASTGNVSYDVPRNQLGHCDRLWSFLLALKGCGEPEVARGVGQAPAFPVA